jgi:hypothetical protein
MAWNDPDSLFEPKHDGFRGLVYITPDRWSRPSAAAAEEATHLGTVLLRRRRCSQDEVVEEYGWALFRLTMPSCRASTHSCL